MRDSSRAALAEASLPPSRLELEITESLLLDDTDAVLAELARLKALGVAIVMDDFGTGYSSLGYLWRFPFDKIKIDRTFMQSLDRVDKTVETIMRTIVGLGHSLHMRVTIEGVEDARQIEFDPRSRLRRGPGLLFRSSHAGDRHSQADARRLPARAGQGRPSRRAEAAHHQVGRRPTPRRDRLV